MNNQDLSTLLAELDAAYEKIGDPKRFLRSHEVYETAQALAIVALFNAYPQLREALRSLMHEKATDSWYTGWQVAVRERDEARAERNARARDVMHLEALVEQQREALRDISEHLQCDPPCKMKPAKGKCGECGAYRFETWCAGCVARAVLAAEVPK